MHKKVWLKKLSENLKVNKFFTSNQRSNDFVLGDSNMEAEKKRPREPSEPKDDVSEGRRSTTPEPAKKKKKVDPVCTSFTEKNI